MAQTAVDLPDPLESKGGGALNSADDLLAQLAGEEVDRLLSEADAEPAPANRSFEPPPAAAPAKRASATDAALDALFDELNAAEIPGVPAPGAAPAAPLAAPSVTQSASAVPVAAAAAGSADAALDDLFNQLNAAEIPGVPAAAVAQASAPSPQMAPAASAPVSPAGGNPVDDLGLDALFAELNAAEIPGAPAVAAAGSAGAAAAGVVAPSTTESVEEALAKRAQSLIDEARRQDGADGAGVAAAGPDSAADALAAEMEADERAHSAALRRMEGSAGSAAPAVAVAAAGGAAVIDEAAVEEAAELDEEALGLDLEGERVPVLVRVLEWINAPLTSLPDRVREMLGKVALVTTFNSVAVLIYVFLFRRA